MAAGLGLPRNHGVIISDVWPKGPAEAAGLMAGDILISVDGQPANDLPSVNYYFRLRDTTDKVPLVVLRGTTELTYNVATVEERNEMDTMTAMADHEKNLVPRLGILGVEIDTRIIALAKGLRDP